MYFENHSLLSHTSSLTWFLEKFAAKRLCHLYCISFLIIIIRIVLGNGNKPEVATTSACVTSPHLQLVWEGIFSPSPPPPSPTPHQLYFLTKLEEKSVLGWCPTSKSWLVSTVRRGLESLDHLGFLALKWLAVSDWVVHGRPTEQRLAESISALTRIFLLIAFLRLSLSSIGGPLCHLQDTVASAAFSETQRHSLCSNCIPLELSFRKWMLLGNLTGKPCNNCNWAFLLWLIFTIPQH